MTMFLAPYTAIADIDGSPLDAGFLFFGEYGKDPELFPVEVFWDADFTVPAAQPIRTRNGYPIRNGSPCKIYLKQAEHSLVVKNKNLSAILVEMNNKGISSSMLVRPNGQSVETSLSNVYSDLSDKQQQIDEKASQQYLDEQLSTKAPQATTYTKIEVDNALSTKAPQSNTYTKTEVDATFSAYVGGRKAYTTLALAQAAQSSLPANTAIEVTNDGANNGTYQWNGTTLTKSAYDPLTQAKAYADGNPLFQPISLTASNNLDAVIKTGFYINTGNSYATPENNYPIKDAGVLLVQSTVTQKSPTGAEILYGTQLFYPQAFDRVYFRTFHYFNNKTWGSWKLLANTGDIDSLDIKLSKDLNQVKNMANVTISNRSYTSAKNLFNLDNVKNNQYVAITTGVLSITTDPVNRGWKSSGYIPVVAGQTYTLSGKIPTAFKTYSFFASNTSITSLGFARFFTDSVTFTVPQGATHVVFTIADPSNQDFENVQLELGTVATAYEPNGSVYSYLESLLPKSVKDAILIGRSNQQKVSVIDQLTVSTEGSTKNLFKKSRQVQSQYINTSGLILTTSIEGAPGWSWLRTEHIPVTPGQKITINAKNYSGGYQAYAFYNTTATGVSAIQWGTYSLPITLTVPAGASYFVMNIGDISNPFNELQIELGETVTTYENGDDDVFLDASKLYPSTNTGGFLSSVKNSGGSLAITCKTKEAVYEQAMRVNRAANRLFSQVVNFYNFYIDGVAVHGMGDDASPMILNDQWIGANHGWFGYKVTATGHGKTVADIGSQWSTLSNKEVVIINVIDENTLFTSFTESSTLSDYSTLTHKANASNAASFSVSAIAIEQWYPSLMNYNLTGSIDGQPIDLTRDFSSTQFKEKFCIHEYYEIPSKNDLIEFTKANVGVNKLDYTGVESTIAFNITYAFDTECGCTVTADFICLKDGATLDKIAGIQSSIMSSSAQLEYYVPKTVPFTVSGTTVDFANKVLLNTTPNLTYKFTPSTAEVGVNPPDRFIQILPTHGFALGYLPILDAEPTRRKDLCTVEYGNIATTRKTYPSFVYKPTAPLLKGKYYSVVAYRKHFKRDQKRTCKYLVTSEQGDFLYLDWHSPKELDVIDLPDLLKGRSFAIHEKSSNVTLVSQVATNKLYVKVDSTRTNGYLVLKFQ